MPSPPGLGPNLRPDALPAAAPGELAGWEMHAVGAPLRPVRRPLEAPGAGEVLVQVAGCGVCHTDLGFLDEGVPTRHSLPLILGHEISGRVVAAGPGAEAWVGRAVVVPAVIPCGACDACARGRGSICARQVFPGNDLDGGFASHVRVPARGLCPVPATAAPFDLSALAVVADAITTPYQSIVRSGLRPGDVAVFVGVGGVGGFGVQIAHALGAAAVAIDVSPERLERLAAYGADLTLDARAADARALKKAVRAFARGRGRPETEWKVFETSGTPAGQQTAFGLLVPGAYLGVVGYTPHRAEVPISHLMAFDARAEGCWGCLPALYPEALALVLDGRVAIEPFIVRRPLAGVNEALEEIRTHRVRERVVLIP